MIEHIRVVKDFSESNMPIMIQSFCDDMSSNLSKIRRLEMSITN